MSLRKFTVDKQTKNSLSVSEFTFDEVILRASVSELKKFRRFLDHFHMAPSLRSSSSWLEK